MAATEVVFMIFQKCYRARKRRRKAYRWCIMHAKLKGLRAPPSQSSYSPMLMPGAHSPHSPAAPLIPVSPKRAWMSQGNEDKTKKKPNHLMPPGLQTPLPIQMPRASSTSQLQDLLSNLSGKVGNKCSHHLLNMICILLYYSRLYIEYSRDLCK